MSVAQVDHVYVHVEEPSMEAALSALLPKMLGDVSFQISNHRCKSELLAKLPARLRGYARFLPPTARVLVVIDRDQDDCVALKQRLDVWAREAGQIARGMDPARNRSRSFQKLREVCEAFRATVTS